MIVKLRNRQKIFSRGCSLAPEAGENWKRLKKLKAIARFIKKNVKVYDITKLKTNPWPKLAETKPWHFSLTDYQKQKEIFLSPDPEKILNK